MVLQVDGIGVEHAKERLKCKTDLFYLGKRWLKHDFVEAVHKPVCDLFVHKNPDKTLEEQDKVKDRLLLDPRGHYKTTIDATDIVQWIICFPDIRINCFSGAEDLVLQITDMVINQFRINEEFKELFFEHAMDPKADFSRHQWNTPARNAELALKRRGPTLFATTIGSVNTGTHCEVMKFDDVVTDNNSRTPENRAKIIYQVNALIPLVEPGGYTDFIGTRYAFDDKYGEFVENLEHPRLVEKIPFGRIIHTETAKVFERKISTLPLTKNSEFLFPVKANGKPAFDWTEVKKRRRKLSEVQFGCQYLNDPQWGLESTFSEEMIKGSFMDLETMPFTMIDPLSGQKRISMRCFQIWDLAYSVKKTADYTAGITGGFDRLGRLYLLDLVVGRFSPDDLINKFMGMYLKWIALMGRCGVEEAGGAKLMLPTLNTLALRAKVPLMIDWLKTSPVATKRERILGLLPLWKTKKIFVNAHLPHMELFMKQFTQYGSGGHDDIPDACSRLLEYGSTVDIHLPNVDPQFPAVPYEENNDTPLGQYFIC